MNIVWNISRNVYTLLGQDSEESFYWQNIVSMWLSTQSQVTGSPTRSRIRPMTWHSTSTDELLRGYKRRFPQTGTGQSQPTPSHLCFSLPDPTPTRPPRQLCHATQAEVRLVSGPRSCIHRERRHKVSLRRVCKHACSTDQSVNAAVFEII